MAECDYGCVTSVLFPLAPSGIGATYLVISISPSSGRSIPASGPAIASCPTGLSVASGSRICVTSAHVTTMTFQVATISSLRYHDGGCIRFIRRRSPPADRRKTLALDSYRRTPIPPVRFRRHIQNKMAELEQET